MEMISVTFLQIQLAFQHHLSTDISFDCCFDQSCKLDNIYLNQVLGSDFFVCGKISFPCSSFLFSTSVALYPATFYINSGDYIIYTYDISYNTIALLGQTSDEGGNVVIGNLQTYPVILLSNQSSYSNGFYAYYSTLVVCYVKFSCTSSASSSHRIIHGFLSSIYILLLLLLLGGYSTITINDCAFSVVDSSVVRSECFIYQMQSNQSIQNCLLIILRFIWLILIFFFFSKKIIFIIGIFCNYSHSSFPAYYNYFCNSNVLVKFDNCTFANITSTSSYYPTGIYANYGEGPLQILNTIFYNLTASSASYGSVVYLNFGSFSYNVSGNSFTKISGNQSAFYCYNSPSSCQFVYNFFTNITSSNNGGVFFFTFKILKNYIIRLFILVQMVQNVHSASPLLLIVLVRIVYYMIFSFIYFIF
jgi:hypothetical protein